MRFLQPLAASLWIWFLIWTVVLAVVWLTGFGEAQATEWAQSHFLTPEQRAAGGVPTLQGPLLALLRLVDPLWLTLAAILAYGSLARERGLATARRWSLLLVIGAVLFVRFLALSAPLHFTSRLGPKIGPISLGWIFLWITVVLGGRECARLFLPRASHQVIAVATGALALATDLNLEPVAWKIRAWWVWSPGVLPAPEQPPMLSYLYWFLGALILSFAFRSPEVAERAPGAKFSRAAVIVLLLNVVSLTTHLLYRLRA